jgi:hypothetical protein
MSSTYSTNLAIELIGTGDQAGTWGTTTNSNLGTLIEQSISGYVTQAVSTGTDTTITIPNGSSGVARNMYIELTGTGGSNTNLIVPANKKLYFIFNNSSGAVTVKVSGQTGVSVPTGNKMVLVSNGTDIVNGLNYIADFASNSATITHLSATSATITNLTLTSLVISNLSIASANITTLTSASATITNLLATSLAVSSIATFAAGSAAAPSITTTGDTNTGIFFPAADTIAFTEGGVESMRIDSSGNVGLGVTPSAFSGAGKNMQFGNGPASIDTQNSGDANFMHNAYESPNGTFKYVGSGIGALRYQLDINNNVHKWYYAASGTANNNITFTQAMTLDASGNLGLGVTPSAWSQFVAFEMGARGNSISSYNSGGVYVGTNCFFNGTNWIYKISSVAPAQYYATEGLHAWQTAAAGTAGNAITFSEKMRLDASGNLGIGTTSPDVKLRVDAASPTRGIVETVRGTGSTGSQIAFSQDAVADWAIGQPAGANAFAFFSGRSPGADGTESLRITSAGDLLVGTTTTGGKVSVFNASGDASQPCIYFQNNKNFTGVQGINANSGNVHNDTGHEFLYCNDIAGGGVVRMTVRSNGGIANYSANNVNLSDERTKKDIAPLGSMWDKFKAIEIVKFKYRDQTHDDDNIGVIAQQVESVAPEFVDIDGFGETPEDGVPFKTVYTTDMYHAAIKALQEAMARIETLEAKVTALESK